MKGQLIHQNLSTSFVDLSALVKHLRGLQFTGSIRVELSSYEAEIIFTPKNRLQAREYDRLLGRISQGEQAFNRILKRAREPFGHISVTQVDPNETVKYLKKAFVDERIVADARENVFGRGDRRVTGTILGLNWLAYKSDRSGDLEKGIELATELLSIISGTFEKGNFDFDKAFQYACEFVSDTYPFLEPLTGKFTFEDSKVILDDHLEIGEMYDGLMAAIQHIFDRLRENTELHKLLLISRDRVNAHIVSRRSEYARLLILRRIERLL